MVALAHRAPALRDVELELDAVEVFGREVGGKEEVEQEDVTGARAINGRTYAANREELGACGADTRARVLDRGRFVEALVQVGAAAGHAHLYIKEATQGDLAFRCVPIHRKEVGWGKHSPSTPGERAAS